MARVIADRDLQQESVRRETKEKELGHATGSSCAITSFQSKTIPKGVEGVLVTIRLQFASRRTARSPKDLAGEWVH